MMPCRSKARVDSCLLGKQQDCLRVAFKLQCAIPEILPEKNSGKQIMHGICVVAKVRLPNGLIIEMFCP